MIIIDMWDATQCVSAARRVVEMARRINEVAAGLWAVPDTALGQNPRRPSPTGFTRDTMSSTLKPDSITGTNLRMLLAPAVQDSSRQCRSTTGYVLFGGFVGFLVGSARYEKGVQQAGADFAPWLTMPLAIGPYVLGGMLLGHLIAPC